LNYIVLLSVLAVIVAESGCFSNTSNNTQAPATTTPETQVTHAETATSAVTPSSVGETPGATERNLQIEQSNTGITSTVSNGALTVKVTASNSGY
jgi:hypothetical protein